MRREASGHNDGRQTARALHSGPVSLQVHLESKEAHSLACRTRVVYRHCWQDSRPGPVTCPWPTIRLQ